MSNHQLFKPMYQQNNSTRTNINTVCKDDSGYIWIDNKLKSGDVFTEIRILPAIDENGDEMLALNPEGGASADQIPATLGSWTAFMEIASIWKNGKRTFVSAVQDTDDEGNPVTSRQTPVMRFMSKVGYKVYEQIRKQEAGLPTDIPEYWYTWRQNGTVAKPQNMYIVRALTNYVNGEAVKDSMGKAEWVPGIFAIPKSAEERFVQDICTRLDPTEDLSLENSEFGDFCSCAGGITVRLKRYDKQSGDGKRSHTTYSLNKGRPMPLDVEHVRGICKEWSDVLYTPTVNECMNTLCELFEPSAIDYAFRDSAFYKYVPESMHGSASGIEEAGDVRKLGEKQSTAPATTTTTISTATPASVSRREFTPGEDEQASFKDMANKLKKQVSSLVE